MTRGRSRKKNQTSRKSTDENVPKQDKVKRLLLLQLDAEVPEEEDQKSL
jgi:hypothetical protein